MIARAFDIPQTGVTYRVRFGFSLNVPARTLAVSVMLYDGGKLLGMAVVDASPNLRPMIFGMIRRYA